MVKRITVDLSENSINSAIKEVRKYKAWVRDKEKELRLRLAAVGATVASIQFNRAIYNGSNDVTVRVGNKGSTAVIYAEGSAVLFIEFGSGAKYGYGHPEAEKHGYGPSTYSDGPEGNGRWDNPHGWWYGHGKHSYGNPPAAAMVAARDSILEQLTTIAKEVFST